MSDNHAYGWVEEIVEAHNKALSNAEMEREWGIKRIQQEILLTDQLQNALREVRKELMQGPTDGEVWDRVSPIIRAALKEKL